MWKEVVTDGNGIRGGTWVIRKEEENVMRLVELDLQIARFHSLYRSEHHHT